MESWLDKGKKFPTTVRTQEKSQSALTSPDTENQKVKGLLQCDHLPEKFQVKLPWCINFENNSKGKQGSQSILLLISLTPCCSNLQ